MGITMRMMTTALGRSGKPERPSFLSRRAHLLTTGRKPAVVSLPSVGPCALHEASAGCFSRGGRQCRSVPLPSLSVRLADGLRLVCLFAANRCPLSGQPPAIRLRKPATAQGTPFGCGSFLAAMDDALPRTVHFLLPRQKKQNRPLQGAERT